MTGGCAGAAERELQAALAGKTALCEQLGGEVEAERAWAAACQESASRAERAVASLEAELRALAASGRNPRTLSTAVSSPSSLQDLQPATLSDDRNNVQTAMMANNDLRQALHPQTAEVSRHCESLSGAEALREGELQRKLEDATSDAAEQLSCLQGEIARLRIEASRAVELQRELENAQNDAAKQVSSLQRENERLQSDASQTAGFRRELEEAREDVERLSSLRRENECLRTEASRAIELQRDLEDGAAKQVSSLQRENERLQDDAFEFQRELEEAREAVGRLSSLQSENERLQAEASRAIELQHELEDAQSDFAKQVFYLQEENERLQVDVSEFQRELEEAREAMNCLSALQRENERLQTETSRAIELQRELEDAQNDTAKQVSHLQDENERLQTETSRAIQLQRELEDAQNDAAKQVSSLQRENERLQADALQTTEFRRELEGAREAVQQVSPLREDNERLQADLSERAELQRKLEEERSEAVRQLSSLQREHECLEAKASETAELQRELVSQRASSERLDRQLRDLQASLDEAAERSAGLEDRNEAQAAAGRAQALAMVDLQRRLDSERASCERLDKQVDQLQAARDDAARRIAGLLDENETLRQENEARCLDPTEELERRLNTERDTCERLSVQLGETQATRDEALQQVAGLERENNRLQQEMADTRDELQGRLVSEQESSERLDKQVDVLQEYCNEALEQVSVLEAENSRLQTAMADSGAELQRELNSERASCQQLRMRVDELQASCDGALEQVSVLERENERLRQAVDDADGTLQRELAAERASCEGLHRHVNDLQAAGNEARDRIAALERENEKLQLRNAAKLRKQAQETELQQEARPHGVAEGLPCTEGKNETFCSEAERHRAKPHGTAEGAQRASLEDGRHSQQQESLRTPRPQHCTAADLRARAGGGGSERRVQPQAFRGAQGAAESTRRTLAKGEGGDTEALRAKQARETELLLARIRGIGKGNATPDSSRVLVASRSPSVSEAPSSPLDVHAPQSIVKEQTRSVRSPHSSQPFSLESSSHSATHLCDGPSCPHPTQPTSLASSAPAYPIDSEHPPQAGLLSTQPNSFASSSTPSAPAGDVIKLHASGQPSPRDVPSSLRHPSRTDPKAGAVGDRLRPACVSSARAPVQPAPTPFHSPRDHASSRPAGAAPQGSGRTGSPNAFPANRMPGDPRSSFDRLLFHASGDSAPSAEDRPPCVHFDRGLPGGAGTSGDAALSEKSQQETVPSAADTPQYAHFDPPQANATSPRRVSATVRHSQRTYEVGTVPGAHSGAGGSSLPTTKARSPGSIPTRFSLRSPLRKPSPGAPADRRGQPDTSAIGILVEKHVAAVVADQRRRGDRRDEFSGPAGKGATWSRKLETSAVDCLVEKHLSALVADHKWRANLSDDRNTRVEKHPGSFDDLRCGTSDSPGKKEAIQKQPGRSPLGSRGAPSFAGEGRRDDSRIERTQDVTKKEGVIQSQLEEGSAIGRLLGEHGGTTIADERRWTQQRATERAAERGDYEEFVRKRATEGTATVRRGSVSTVSTPVKATRDGQKPWIAEQDELGGGPQPPGRERSRGSLDGASVGTSNERAGGVRALARKVSLKHFGEVPEIAEVLAAALDGERERSRKLEGVNKRLEATRSSWEAEVSELKQDLGKERDRASALQQSLATVSSATKATRAQQSRLSLVVDATAALATAARRRAINAEMASQQSALELQLHRNYNASPYHSQPTTPPGS
eukprot:gene14312-21945_t